MQLISQLSEKKPVTNEDILLLCNLPGSAKSPHVLYSHLRQHLLGMRHLPVVSLLVTKEKDDLSTLFHEVEANNTAEVSTSLPENSLCAWHTLRSLDLTNGDISISIVTYSQIRNVLPWKQWVTQASEVSHLHLVYCWRELVTEREHS